MAVDPCTEYSVALALEDFVPVLLAGAGSIVLAQAAGRVLPSVRLPALLAGLLVTFGGFCKALWKLLVAAEPCRDYPVLEGMLFPCLAFGFAGIACALVGVWRGAPAPWWPFLVIPGVGALIALQTSDMWPLLMVTAIGAVFVGILGIRLSRRYGYPAGVVLYVVYIVGSLVLPPLGARPHQSEEVQWAEQLTNSVIQLCFLLGAIGIRRRIAPADVPAPTTAGARQ